MTAGRCSFPQLPPPRHTCSAVSWAARPLSCVVLPCAVSQGRAASVRAVDSSVLCPPRPPPPLCCNAGVLAIFGCECDQVPPGSPCFPVTPATEDQGPPESAAAATIAPVVPFPWQLDSSPAYSAKGQPHLRAVAVQMPAGTTHPSLAWLQQGSVGLHHELGRRQPSHACGAVSSGTVLSSLGLEQGSSNLADAGCCWSGSMA